MVSHEEFYKISSKTGGEKKTNTQSERTSKGMASCPAVPVVPFVALASMPFAVACEPTAAPGPCGTAAVPAVAATIPAAGAPATGCTDVAVATVPVVDVPCCTVLPMG